MWDEPTHEAFLRRLASFSRLILFDKRGTGLSDRVSVDRLPTLDDRMDDVRAVMDAAGSESAAVFGTSEGGVMSALFAATYPQRTAALILYGTYAKRIRTPDYPWAPTAAERERDIEGVEQAWGAPRSSTCWLQALQTTRDCRTGGLATCVYPPAQERRLHCSR